MMDCGDMRGPQDPHSSSQVATHSEMLCVPLFCTRPNVPRGCYLARVCVCVRLCVSVWTSSLQRRLIRPWEYPLWQHIRTSLSLVWHPPLITAPWLFDCSFIALCPSPCCEGDDVTTHELCEFRGLPKGEIQCMDKKSGNTNRAKDSSEFVLACISFFYDSGWRKKKKDHFHPMMKLLPEGSNDFQDANCPRSTDWVVNANWVAVYYKFTTSKCIICSFDMFVQLCKSEQKPPKWKWSSWLLAWKHVELETVICVAERFWINQSVLQIKYKSRTYPIPSQRVNPKHNPSCHFCSPTLGNPIQEIMCLQLICFVNNLREF